MRHVVITGLALVTLVLLTMLGDLRITFVAAVTILFAVLVAFAMMVLTDPPANLISIGAIDFGILVDSSIIVLESVYRKLTRRTPTDQTVDLIVAGVGEAAPVLFSTVIILVAFIPLFTMEGVPGKIFSPMSVTYGFALFGDNFDEPTRLSDKISDVMGKVPGVADIGVFKVGGQPSLMSQIDREKAARYGILSGDINAVIQAAVGGAAVSQIIQGDRRFDLTVRYPDANRGTPDSIRNILVPTADGARIPLGQIAEVGIKEGSFMIYREDGRDRNASVCDGRRHRGAVCNAYGVFDFGGGRVYLADRHGNSGRGGVPLRRASRAGCGPHRGRPGARLPGRDGAGRDGLHGRQPGPAAGGDVVRQRRTGATATGARGRRRHGDDGDRGAFPASAPSSAKRTGKTGMRINPERTRIGADSSVKFAPDPPFFAAPGPRAAGLDFREDSRSCWKSWFGLTV